MSAACGEMAATPTREEYTDLIPPRTRHATRGTRYAAAWHGTLWAVLGGLTVATAACEREQRRFREAAQATAATPAAGSALQPGPAVITTADTQPWQRPVTHPTRDPYAENAWAIAQGQKLFDQMNCSGCHSHGGGGMGPALMDATWIYGSDPSIIFETIVEGRPNGMPSFRGKLSNTQVWQLVAYVRALSGMGRKDVRPGRRDNMMMRSSEQNTQTRPPVRSGVPRQTEAP